MLLMMLIERCLPPQTKCRGCQIERRSRQQRTRRSHAGDEPPRVHNIERCPPLLSAAERRRRAPPERPERHIPRMSPPPHIANECREY